MTVQNPALSNAQSFHVSNVESSLPSDIKQIEIDQKQSSPG